jgi:hypothetical protein
MIGPEDIVIRPATESDGPETCKLLKDLGLNLPADEQGIVTHWNRLWKQNPYYRKFEEPIQFGWIMEHEKRIVGFFGSIQRIYLFNSRPVRVSIASQWGVKKEYRAFTSLLCDQYFQNNTCPVKIVTTAIKPTGRIFTKYGGHKIPNENLGLVYMIPIKLFRVIAAKFSNPIVKSICSLADKIVPWRFQFNFIKRNNNITKIQIESHSKDLDAFFDIFHKNKEGLVALRTSEILKWHGSGNKGKTEKEYFVFTKNSKIEGFASISKEGIPKSPELIRYKITDLVTNSTLVKKSLLKELVRVSFERNADVVEIHHPGMIDKSNISSFFVFTRKHLHFPFYFQTSDKRLESTLRDESNWNISPFDGDTAL